MQILKPGDILKMSNGCLYVNGAPFVVEEMEGETIFDVEDNQLVTLFRGHFRNYYKPEEINGYWA